MRRAGRALVALAVLAAVVAGAVVLVRATNGDFSGDYPVTGTFPRAGEGLDPGSLVVFRGVPVGRVSTIRLAGTDARVTLLIDPGFAVPTDTTATIEPVNLFGAQQVALTTPGGTRDGPYLAPGAQFAHTADTDVLGDLFDAAVPLLDRIDTTDLSNVLGDLAQASAGEGPQLARSIQAGAQLASSLDASLQAQLTALDAFTRFTAALAPDGPDLNALSGATQAALPDFNAEAADYQRLLEAVTPFAQHLTTLLADYHPDIAQLLVDGDNPARVLTLQRQDIGQVVAGAYDFAYKVGHGASPDALPDGSRYAYFNTFIVFSDVNQLVCSLLAPDQSGLSFLEPLQSALAGAGSAFNCSSQMATFDQAQTQPPPATTAASAAAAATPAARPAAQHLDTDLYGLAGAPEPDLGTESLRTYVQALLGAL